MWSLIGIFTFHHLSFIFKIVEKVLETWTNEAGSLEFNGQLESINQYLNQIIVLKEIFFH